MMIKIRYDYSLLEHNSFRIDAKASEFAEYSSAEDLRAFLPIRNRQKPLFHIGGGNNLLFTRDFDGIILHSAIRGIDVEEETQESVLLKVGAAEVWDNLVGETLSRGLYGLENLSLIPSEVGAAAVQNIGAYGAEAKDVVERVEVVDLEDGSIREFANAECSFAYRYSNFKGAWRGRYAVTHVFIRLNKEFRPNLSYKAVAQVYTPDMTAMELRQAIIDIRRNKLPDPAVIPNAGSFFMNPVVSDEEFARLQKAWPGIPHYRMETGVKVPAAWLIEQCGWKGRALGRAAVYDKQPLVLVNRGSATGGDIVRLAEAVRSSVKDKFNIEIRPEVNWL